MELPDCLNCTCSYVKQDHMLMSYHSGSLQCQIMEQELCCVEGSA